MAQVILVEACLSVTIYSAAFWLARNDPAAVRRPVAARAFSYLVGMMVPILPYTLYIISSGDRFYGPLHEFVVLLFFFNGAVNSALYSYWMHWDRRAARSESAEALHAAEQSVLYRGYFDLSNGQSDSMREANRVVALAVADMRDVRRCHGQLAIWLAC